MKKTFFALLIIMALLASASVAEKKLNTREYFEKLDKESRLEDIVRDLGGYGVKGSGILYFVWHLDDGSEASLLFNSKGQIEMITIVGETASERIYRREHPAVETDAVSFDMDEAISKMQQAISEKNLPGGGLISSDPERRLIALFDVTGDGSEDLCTCVTWGSGMVRTDLVVYDPLNEEIYMLDGYNYNYLIDHVEEDRIVIVMEGPNGYGGPITQTYGTVILDNGVLVFVADSEEP